jgi:hypothetical protein
MDAFLTPTAILIHVASLLALIGMLMRDQLWLRLFVLVGGFFEIAYYWTYPATPLWPSIGWAFLIAAVNIWVMGRLWHDRREGRMTPEEREMYQYLSGLTPGEFRRLRRSGRRQEGRTEVRLTAEGVVPGQLHFVHRGDIMIRKGGREFYAFPPAFIGEVSLLLGGGATATVTLPEGGLWFSWDREALKALLAREPTIRAAFDRILNRDLAGKLARS